MKKLRGTDLELKFQSLLIISATYSEQENSGHCIGRRCLIKGVLVKLAQQFDKK